MKSEEANFALSYCDPKERDVIDNLLSVTLISTYGHKYSVNQNELRRTICEVQNLPEASALDND